MARTYTQLNRELGSRIRARREALGISREALAERLDVTPHYLGEVERGSTGLALPTYKRVCEVLGVQDSFLLFGEQVPVQASAEEIRNFLSGVSPCLYPRLMASLRSQIELIEAAERLGTESVYSAPPSKTGETPSRTAGTAILVLSAPKMAANFPKLCRGVAKPAILSYNRSAWKASKELLFCFPS